MQDTDTCLTDNSNDSESEFFSSSTNDDELTLLTEDEDDEELSGGNIINPVPSSISPSQHESNAQQVLSCLLRNNVNETACVDILRCLKATFLASQGERFVELLDYNRLRDHVTTASFKDVHYCELCNLLFLEDPDAFRCCNKTCKGLRYIGKEHLQLKKGQRPKASFVLADIASQLENLLLSPGM